jgi:hypothetical protein
VVQSQRQLGLLIMQEVMVVQAETPISVIWEVEAVEEQLDQAAQAAQAEVDQLVLLELLEVAVVVQMEDQLAVVQR